MTDIDVLAREAVQRAKGEVAMFDVPEVEDVMDARRRQHRTRMAVATLALVVVLGGGAAVAVAASGGKSNAPAPVEVKPVINKSAVEFRPVQSEYPCPSPASHGPGPVANEFRDRDGQVCYVTGPVVLDAAHITGAQAELDPNHDWIVRLHFDNDDFVTKVAEPYVNKNIAIVVDGVVQSAPLINPGITGRDVQVMGNLNEPQAKELVAKILGVDVSHVSVPTTATTVHRAVTTGLLLSGIDPNAGAAVSASARPGEVATAVARHDAMSGWVVDVTLNADAAARFTPKMQFGAQVSGENVRVVRNGSTFVLLGSDVQKLLSGGASTWTRAQADAIAKAILAAR